MTKTAIYVGSFDPITLGHLDIIRQASLVFDLVYVFIGVNPRKTPTFDIDERVAMITESIKEVGLDDTRISTGWYQGSMMKIARSVQASSIVRGLRQISDFGDEFSINGMVARALPEIPMTYFICRQDFLHVSSSSVKEMFSLGESIDWMVTESVKKEIAKIK